MRYIELLNSPLLVIVALLIFFLVFLRRTHLDFPAFVTAVNNISSQPFALLVLVIGFWMLVECKKFGIDTTIAGGVIGVASNMLQAQLKEAAHPPGSIVKTESVTATPPITDAVEEAAKPVALPLQGRAYKNINLK
jgi:hypothetical protein